MNKNNKKLLTKNVNTNVAKKDKMVEKEELCQHMYYNYFNDDNGKEEYSLYALHNVAYPCKFVNISLTYSKMMEVEPYIIILLEIIKEYKGSDLITYIEQETKTDRDIIEYTLADFIKTGFVSKDGQGEEYTISFYGLELIEKRKKREIFNDKVVMKYDMITNDIVDIYTSNDRPKVTRMNKDKDFELQGKLNFRPDKYSLDSEMKNGNIYRKVLYEKLRKFYNQLEENSEDITIENIKEIEIFNDMTYDFYYILFYTDRCENDKYLVIGDDNEIDEDRTEKIEKCLKEGLINFKHNKEIKYEIEKLEEKKKRGQEIASQLAKGELDTKKHRAIQKEEHSIFLLEAFKTATKSICISSPWIRCKVLEIYKDYIEKSLEAGVHIYLNYGIEGDRKNDKPIIDDSAKKYLDELGRKYKNLHINSKANTHEKILTCDDKWCIVGSFNWFSYDGSGERGESSILNVDKPIIDVLKQKFI